MALTAGRFYFKRSVHGVLTEMKDHALNGSVVAGAGPAVDPVAFNKPRGTSWDRRRTEIQIFANGKEQTITTAFFDNESVEVYEWWPNPEARSTYMLVPKIVKTGNFEDDVRSGYYNNYPQDFCQDHKKWLEEDQGVPSQYAGKVASYAWQEGHSSGFSEILNVSYGIAEIFQK